MNLILTICRRARVAMAEATDVERGSVAILVIGLAIALFACAGLAIDGGRAINARDKAADIAEQAARAGASQLDPVALREQGGTVILNPGPACEVASRFVTDIHEGYSEHHDCTFRSVHVVVYTTYHTALLGIIGIDSINVSGSAAAGAATSINGVTP